MAFCLLLLFCALPGVVFSCSCFPGSFNRPRTQAIQEDFCGEYSRPDVYTARVVGATCNCIPASGDANLQCQDYTFATGNTSVVNVEVVNRTRLPDERSCRRPSSYEVDTCSAQATRLAGLGITVENVTTDLPPVVNRTDSDCFYSCPFNDRSSSEYIQWIGAVQPCVYTLEVTRVFKGNYERGETLVVVGPDVLTTCGAPGILLQFQEDYVVGIGGVCNPIAEWSTVSSYSSSELDLLTQLASGCRAFTEATTNTPTLTTTEEIPQRNMCAVLQQIASRAPGNFECSTNQRCDGVDCTADPLNNGMPFQYRAVILVCQLPRPAVEILLLGSNGAVIVNETVDHSEVLSFRQFLQLNITLNQYQNAIGLQVEATLLNNPPAPIIEYTLIPIDTSNCQRPTLSPLSSGAVAGVVLGGLVFLIVLAGIAVCVGVLVYGYRHPTSKIGLFMIEHRPKAKSLNEKSSYNVESGKTAIDEKE